MNRVVNDRKWVINTREDYENAMKELDGNDFIAEMSDDFSYWRSEKAEVAKQRAQVIAQAKEKGII